MFEKKICDYVPEPVKRNLENDVIKGMLDAGEPIYGYCSPEYVKDVGTVDRVEQTLADIARGVIADKCLKNKQRCIFMDRDGTINQYKGLVYKEDDFVLEDCAVDAIRKINQSGRLGIVITNNRLLQEVSAELRTWRISIKRWRHCSEKRACS